MSGLKWAIAVLALLALVGAGCGRQKVGPSVGDYQKQRSAMIEKQRKDQTGPQALAVARADEAAEPADSIDSAQAKDVREHITALLQLRRDHPALVDGTSHVVALDDERGTLLLARVGHGEALLVAMAGSRGGDEVPLPRDVVVHDLLKGVLPDGALSLPIDPPRPSFVCLSGTGTAGTPE